MSITAGISELHALHTLPFPSQLSLLIAAVQEVYPSTPSTGGSRQQLRLADGRGSRIDVQLFDQGAAVPMNAVGMLMRLSASPNAKRAMVWEQSKAVSPRHRVGTLVVRAQAKLELFTTAQAATMGVSAMGFLVAEASSRPQTVQPAPVAQAPEFMPTTLGTGHVAPREGADPTAVEIARCFSECLTAAKTVLGPSASAEDVQATARATFDQMMSRRPAA